VTVFSNFFFFVCPNFGQKRIIMKTKALFFCFVVVLIVLADYSYAQFNIKDKFKEKSTNRAEERVDEGLTKY
jgi:hypothetical protein